MVFIVHAVVLKPHHNVIGTVPSVDTLVLILGTSPYKDQNEKNGPYLVLIMEFWSLFSKNGVMNGKS